MSAANNLKSDHITFFSLCYFLSFSFSFIFLSCCNSCSRYVYMNATHLPLTWTLLYMLSFSFFAFHKKKLTIKRKAYLKGKKVSHIISMSAVIMNMNMWTLEEKLFIQWEKICIQIWIDAKAWQRINFSLHINFISMKGFQDKNYCPVCLFN